MSTPHPLIALIVPVHNAGAFLRPCLESIVAQRCKNYICVLVDDGSTDGSGKICLACASANPQFLCITQNASGAAAARAAGLALALRQGAEWIAFCDADDLLHPDFLRTMYRAAFLAKMPVACCRYDSFSGAAPQESAPFSGKLELLREPAHLDALLHRHAMDYSLCNKLYDSRYITPLMLDNGFAHNEDLLANWQVFSLVEGCVYFDWVGYHYRQHAESASHRPLAPESIDDQRNAAIYIREHAAPDMQASANAFYYEKLVYLASMILRREDAADYRVQLNELNVVITAGLKDRNLGRNPHLPLSIKLAAIATTKFPLQWRKLCRKLLRDRQ